MKGLLLALSLWAPCGWTAAGSSLKELKVLTFNVGGIPIVHPHWQKRLHAIGPALREAGYDLVALQEVWRDKDALALSRESGLPHFARYERGIALGTGLVLLSRFPILEKSQATFTCKPSKLRILQGEAIANKGVLMARVMTPAGPLDVYNAHLISDYPRAPYRALRLTQLFELSEMVERLSSDRPFLILADLNAGPGDLEYEVLRDLLGLEDPCLRKGRELCGRTDGVKRVDHVLFPRGGSLSATVQTAFTEPISGTVIPYSDHSALEASLGRRLLSLRLNPDSERRARALKSVQAEISGMTEAMGRRAGRRAWIPVYGFLMSLRYDHQLAQLSGLKTRAESALIRALGRGVARSR